MGMMPPGSWPSRTSVPLSPGRGQAGRGAVTAVPAHPGRRAPRWPCLNVSLKGFAGLLSRAVIWRLPFICSSVSGSRESSLDL